jgi:hypothetical protein
MIEGWGFNPPPYWPKPPGSWMPPPGWRPDPAWGPVPPGWQLWIPAPRPRRRRSPVRLLVGLVAVLMIVAAAVLVPRGEGPRADDPRAAAAMLLGPGAPALIAAVDGSDSPTVPGRVPAGQRPAAVPGTASEGETPANAVRTGSAGAGAGSVAAAGAEGATVAGDSGPQTATLSTTGLPVAVIRQFRTCAALNQVYPNGVGMPDAVDRTTGTPVTRFGRSTTIYRMNLKHDRDGDGIACEPVS